MLILIYNLIAAGVKGRKRKEMDKIKFADGKTYDIVGAAAESITFDTTMADLTAIHGEFTQSNMASMTVLDSTGKTVLRTLEHYKPTGKMTITDISTGVEAVVEIQKMSALEVATLDNAEAIAELSALIATK